MSSGPDGGMGDARRLERAVEAALARMVAERGAPGRGAEVNVAAVALPAGDPGGAELDPIAQEIAGWVYAAASNRR